MSAQGLYKPGVNLEYRNVGCSRSQDVILMDKIYFYSGSTHLMNQK